MIRRRIGFLVLGLLSLWAVLYSGMAVFYYVFFLFAIVFVLSLLQVLLSFLSFRLRTNISSFTAEKGAPFSWKLLSKGRFLPVAHAKVHVRFPDISETNEYYRDYYVSPAFLDTTPVNITITSPYCGKFPLEVTGIEITDIFGLWHIKSLPKRYLPQNPIHVTVLPDTSALLHGDLLYDEIMLPVRRTKERAEAVGIREYTRGDNMRSIHWKYSARMGKLHVKEYEKGSKELHLIYLDVTDSPLKGTAAVMAKDQLLCSAASLCHALLIEQIPMVILAYSSKSNGRFSLIHKSEWENARLFLAQSEFNEEIPSDYKEMIAGYILAEKSTLTVFSMAVTASPLSFLSYRSGDYSSVSVCFIPQLGFNTEQQGLVHLYADKGIHTLLLSPPMQPPSPASPAPSPASPAPPEVKEGDLK